MTVRRVGFVLCSSVAHAIPSTRIAVLNILPFLQSAGFQPCIVFEPPQPDERPVLAGVAKQVLEAGCEVVVLQKVHGSEAVALAQDLASAGVRTIYAVCDLVDVEMVQATDATITVTEYLKSLYPKWLQSCIHVVHDGIEKPAICKSEWGTMKADTINPLRAVLVTSSALDRLPVIGSPPAWLNVRIVGRYSRGFDRWRAVRWKWVAQPAGERLDYLRFLTDSRIKCVPWDPEGVYRELTQADIGVIPIETPADDPGGDASHSWKNKSENRLTLKMSIGLPVIATPIPSYEAVIEHGVNGFLARSARDWATCLSALRDPARRREMGLAARASVIERYSMQEQSARLIRVLQDTCIMPKRIST